MTSTSGPRRPGRISPRSPGGGSFRRTVRSVGILFGVMVASYSFTSSTTVGIPVVEPLLEPILAVAPPVVQRPDVPDWAHERVDYWIGRVRDDEGFAPDEEVDEIRWVPVSEASGFLTYSDDAELVRLAAGAPTTTPLVILRHAKAMKRADFDGDDDSHRPLSGRGRGEAKRLVEVLDAFGVLQIHSSPFKRCVSTVSRYAKSIDADVFHDHCLSETGHAENPDTAIQHVRELLEVREPLVLCTHRPVLPTVVSSLADALGLAPATVNDDPNWDPRLPPGAIIVIHREWTDSGPRAFAVEQHHLPR